MLRLALFLILIAMMPTASMAQTAVSEKIANAYYQTCMSRDDTRLSDETQDSLCSCISVRMMSALTLEDVATMSPNQGLGRPAFDKMLTTVYAPCMRTPVEDVLHQQCMNDRKIKEFSLRDPDKLCRCTATRSGDFFDIQAQDMMTSILRHAPDLSDPIDYILNDRGLRQRSADILFECLKE